MNRQIISPQRSKLKILVLSGCYPARPQFKSPENHANYCRRNGYFYINANYPTTARLKFLNKIYWILEYIESYDYVFWIDDDAFFINQNIRLETFIQDGKFLTICEGPKNQKYKTIVSSGQFMISSCTESINFLKSIMSTDIGHVKNWWSDRVDRLGIFTSGDQDLIVYLMEISPEIKSGISVLTYESFNSRVECVRAKAPGDVFIVHITGIMWVKVKKYRELTHILDLDSTLIQQSFRTDLMVEHMGPWSVFLKRLKNIIYWVKSWAFFA